MRSRRRHGCLSLRATLLGVGLTVLWALPGTAPASVLPHGLGLAEAPQPSSRATKVIRFSAGALPTSVDLTPYAPPVGDQGQVNSCAAWATDYTALGYWENRQGIAGGVLAPMYTYSQVTGGVNTGTTLESHLSIAKSQGVDSWAHYSQGPYNYWALPTPSEIANAANWKLTNATQLALGESANSTVTQQSIEQAVAAGQPVVIGIPVYDNFMYLSSANHGYYSGISGAFEGGHALTVLGYDATGVRIENSWGTGWGDSGFATLSWSFINQYALDAVAVGQLVGSAPATTAPVNTGLPVISGSPAVGQTLTASLGIWSPSGTSSSVRWQRSTDRVGWSDIAGATSLSYATQTGDLGAYVRVIVTESNSYGEANATSAAVGPLASGPPVSTSPPTVSGTARVGATVTATPGGWVPAGGSYSYAWQYSADGYSGWVSIAGANAASFTIGTVYAGTYLRVRVTATNAAGATTATSGPVGPVTVVAAVNTARPTISGTARVGQTLKATAGRWSMPGALVYAWQYSANGRTGWVTIPGARTATFTISSAYLSTHLRVRVTMGTVSAYSASTGPVGNATQRRTTLRVGRARVSARTVVFTVRVARGTGRPQATAVTPGHRVRLRARGGGSRFVFSGRLTKARWLVTVTLRPTHRTFVVVVKH
jgi:hypothetical protein